MSEFYKGGIKNVNSINNEDVLKKVSVDKVENQIAGYNFFGEPVYGKGCLAEGVPGYYDSNGIPRPKYQDPDENVDGNGFDLHYPIIEHYHIPKGTIIIRFGNKYGHFFSIKDACFDNLAIGLDIQSIPYRRYMVTADDFYVTKGIVGKQPYFGSYGSGGGIQYMTHYSAYALVENGTLTEI